MKRWPVFLLLLLLTGQSQAQITPRIVGGEDAVSDKWPWMAKLKIATESGYDLCGGSQISKHWVITAAHCMKPEGNEAGTGDVTVTPRSGSATLAKDILVHSGYNGDQKKPKYNHDLALIQITETRQPSWPSIFSDDQSHDLENGNKAALQNRVTALGHGLIQTDPDKYPSTLQSVNLDYIPRDQCRTKTGLTLTESMVCAGKPKSASQDTCFGDSGGPLLSVENETLSVENQTPWLVGLTSFGLSGACANGDPGVYTNLSAEVGELETLTAPTPYPLIDLLARWDETEPARLYSKEDAIALSVVLTNNSQHNDAHSLSIDLSSSDPGQIRATCKSTPCTSRNTLAPGEQTLAEIEVNALDGGDLKATLTLQASASEEDYRQSNNSLTRNLVLSKKPDLGVQARQTTSHVIDDGTARAQVKVTVTNHANNPADAAQLEITLPTATRLTNAAALACQGNSPVRCPVDVAPNNQSVLDLTLEADSATSRELKLNATSEEGSFPGDRTADSVTLSYQRDSNGGSGSSSGGSLGAAGLLLGLLLGQRCQTRRDALSEGAR